MKKTNRGINHPHCGEHSARTAQGFNADKLHTGHQVQKAWVLYREMERWCNEHRAIIERSYEFSLRSLQRQLDHQLIDQRIFDCIKNEIEDDYATSLKQVDGESERIIRKAMKIARAETLDDLKSLFRGLDLMGRTRFN